jgi:hypothetical protein
VVAIGVCTLDLFLGEANSLKEKRRLLKSMLDRVRARFNVSIAEVEQQELWQRATLAFACVSNERAHADSTLNAVVRYLEKLGAQITDCRTEIF